MSARMALGLLCLLAGMLQGSVDYPAKPVRMIEPFGAGGGPDLIARAVSPKLSEVLGSARDGREPSRRRKYSGPRPGREVTCRRLHVAREHQRSGVQRHAREEPTV